MLNSDTITTDLPILFYLLADSGAIKTKIKLANLMYSGKKTLKTNNMLFLSGFLSLSFYQVKQSNIFNFL